ncbi:MAG: glycosyl hydrolase [Phycisphaerae bacterium]|nr:glycosyl hydrolase [Phycisphaerae bacterium]
MGVDLDRADAASASDDVPAPLFRDPPFDGAADPVVVFNPSRGAWWMLYTQRRARLHLPGVEWCHQTKLGVAESVDGGATWRYLETLPLPSGDEPHSLWAPDIVRGDDGRHHLFVTVVPGVHVDWSGTRFIDHYVAADLGSGELGRWTRVGRLPLTSDRCIDPSLFRKPGGGWRLWYKDEAHGSATLAVDSDDLVTWTPAADPGVSELYGEAPKVFALGGFHWLLKDPDSGLDVYRSRDLTEWTYQGKILETPGTRLDDGSIGKHADVVVEGDRALIVYFTHPYGQDFPERNGVMPYPARRSSIQCAELRVVDGALVCDRDAPVTLRLRSPFADTTALPQP